MTSVVNLGNCGETMTGLQSQIWLAIAGLRVTFCPGASVVLCRLSLTCCTKHTAYGKRLEALLLLFVFSSSFLLRGKVLKYLCLLQQKC